MSDGRDAFLNLRAVREPRRGPSSDRTRAVEARCRRHQPSTPERLSTRATTTAGDDPDDDREHEQHDARGR